MMLRRDLCLGTLEGLPPSSIGYRPALRDQLEQVKDAGVEGVVAWDRWNEVHDAGLIAIGMGRIVTPGEALELAQRHAAAGLEFTTLHVGTGFESDDEMARLADAVLSASVQSGHAFHVETHRGTMTQDIYRTLQLVDRFPDLAITLDFSHWYTGHEMTYGGEFEARLQRLTPVFKNVRSFQLRIGDTGRIQRPLAPEAAYVQDHLRAFSLCIETLAQCGHRPAHISVAPELLAAKMGAGSDARWICYAEPDEQNDRVRDAMTLFDLVNAQLGHRAQDLPPVPDTLGDLS